MAQDLNALIERLEDLIAQAEADMAADAADAEKTGERVDLYEYEIELPVEVAKSFAQALRDLQPVRDEEVQSRVLHSALISSFDEWTEPNEAATDLEAIRAAMRRYLPPDSGITAEDFASEVIGIVDRRPHA